MKTLPPIVETTDDYEEIEKRILALFKKEIYLPLLRDAGIAKSRIDNTLEDLSEAIASGRIRFYRGQFTGRFNSTLSKELKRLGARWDRTHGSWKIPLSSLPKDLIRAISLSETRFISKIQAVDRTLSSILPEQIADKIKVSDLFENAVWKVEKLFKKQITVGPGLTRDQSKRIASEWQNNMKLYIKDFAEKEIIKLRKQVQLSTFSGSRYESLVGTIQKSYGVTANKAKFLARQETSLLMAKFKQTRYEQAGVQEYMWGCVAGSANHPVRPMHKALQGKIFKWDQPPITSEDGRKNNPGQDYNCRCFAKPIIRR